MSELSLKKAIQNLSYGSADVLLGIVKSVSPLVIVPEHDEKLSLGAGSLYIPLHLRNHTVSVSIPELKLSKVKMEVEADLKKGERLYLLSLNQGRKYMVIGRMEE